MIAHRKFKFLMSKVLVILMNLKVSEISSIGRREMLLFSRTDYWHNFVGRFYGYKFENYFFIKKLVIPSKVFIFNSSMPAAPLNFFGNLMRNSGGFFLYGLAGLLRLKFRNFLTGKKLVCSNGSTIHQSSKPPAPLHGCVIRGVFFCPEIGLSRNQEEVCA